MDTLGKDDSWQSKEAWAPYQVPELPGAYFFCDILSPDQQTEFLSSYQDQLEFAKRGYISGTKGPSVSAVQPTRSISKDFPPCLRKLVDAYINHPLKPLERDPYQISVNAYKAGDLMVPHKDGIGNFGLITTLGSSLLLDFYHKPKGKNPTETEVYGKAGTWADQVPGRKIPDEPEISIVMVPGSALLLSGASFLDYVHAIEGRQEDVITDKVGNLKLVSAHRKFKVGDVIQRANRVSLVMWDVEARPKSREEK